MVLSIENLLGVVRKIQGRCGNLGFFQAVEHHVQYIIVVPDTVIVAVHPPGLSGCMTFPNADSSSAPV